MSLQDTWQEWLDKRDEIRERLEYLQVRLEEAKAYSPLTAKYLEEAKVNGHTHRLRAILKQKKIEAINKEIEECRTQLEEYGVSNTQNESQLQHPTH